MIEPTAPRLLCVGTHHKTGTIWMRRVFRAIARELGIFSMFVHRSTPLSRIPQQGRALLFNWSSKFPPDLLKQGTTRVLHMIRDPRDVLISGMKYHQIAPVGGEEFLHSPREDLNGMTYQEHLISLPDDAARLQFEMGHKHRETISQMRDWDYQRPGNIELRYEDLIKDETCGLFENALRCFGFTEAEIAKGRQIFWNNSLFGGLKAPNSRDTRVNLHVRAGHAAQWKTALPRAVAQIYQRDYGDDLIALGYEKNKNWLNQLNA